MVWRACFGIVKALRLSYWQKFDVYEWKHCPSCFKKGPECRFNIYQKSCRATHVVFDDRKEGKANVTYWYSLNDKLPSDTVPYIVEIK